MKLCATGAMFTVIKGVVRVRDFSLERSITLRSGESYIALPRNKRRGSSTG